MYKDVTVSGSLPRVTSEEDTNIKALVTAWLKSLPHTDPSTSSALEGWIEDYFYQALDWVTKSGELVVNTTQVGVAMNGLSHLVGVASKAEFACALVRGLGGNLPQPTKEKFAKEVRRSPCLSDTDVQPTTHPLTSAFSPSSLTRCSTLHMRYHQIPAGYWTHTMTITLADWPPTSWRYYIHSSLMYTYMYIGCSPALSYQTTLLWRTSQAVLMPLSLWSSLQTCSGIGTCSSPGSIPPTNSLS